VRGSRVVPPILVALATSVAFLPALWGEFVSWDDLTMFPDNPHYRGLGPSQLAWMLTTFHVGEFMPFTWLSYGLDYLLWGLDPFGYHLTNLLLHAAASVAVYGLVLQLLAPGAGAFRAAEPTDRRLAAATAALAFGIHPLRAEPVAWVSARGSILGGLFLVLATLAYLRACAGTSARRDWYAGSVGLFTLALLSRSTSIMLPVVLVVLDVYPLRRLGVPPVGWLGPAARRVWLEKVPFVLLSLPIAGLALAARFGEAAPVLEAKELLTGLVVALSGLAFYPRKTLLLGALSPLYERPPRLDPWQWTFLLSAAAVVALTLILVAVRRRWPAGLAAWVSYVALLAPTLGVVPFGLQLVADRYSYAAGLGGAVLIGAGVLAWCDARRQGRVSGPAWTTVFGLALVAVAGLGALSWRQTQVWRDSKTLWTHVATVEPRSAVAHVSLGRLFEREGDLARAEEHYRQAAAVWPTSSLVHTEVARFLTRQGRLADSIAELERAVTRRPTVEMHRQLGHALVVAGRIPEAIAQYEEALRLRPGSAATLYWLGLALAADRRLAEAIEHFRAAVSLEPGFREARAELDRALRRVTPTRAPSR
jgi:Tfp pilus assembly protein PilF